VSIGSNNMTRHNFDWNGEANLMTGDPTVVGRFRAMVDVDLRYSRRIGDVGTLARRNQGDLGEAFWVIVTRWIRGFI
jgi:phosphatidylserine/phosphatidylglycerophosphate/cardiolipin synthase-like enzyme